MEAIKRIPVCEPLLAGNEIAYVTEAMKTGWISSAGEYIGRFEKAFSAYCGVRQGIAVTNGTVALHLALRTLDIGPGDEVLIPNFTMIASAFAVCYLGAKPVFVEAEPGTWNMDPARIEEKISPRTKAIMPVHVFGAMCDMDAIGDIAKRRHLAVVEDAAEAHGAEYKGKKSGSFSSIAAFSFYANKNVATGEGGMVVTDDEELADRARYFKNVCFPTDGSRRYIHEDIGYNYRMSNLHAAIGLAQTERADVYRDLRIAHFERYRKNLAGVEGLSLQETPPHCLHVHWMNALLVDAASFGKSRDEVIAHLKARGVETRLLFTGMQRQPALKKYGCDCSGSYPVTDRVTEQGFYLPSGSGLSDADIDYVCDCLLETRK
jgi:perosamine synthetase